MENNKIINGDSLEVLKTLEENSIDSIVTDPPYGINFMGKKWDYDVPSVEVWKECIRVLKPGGHLLSACGTRTQHRMAVNIEDAGFEIRDIISWLYGSGFPKSLNIGKQIDKMGAKDISWFGKWLREWRNKRGISSNDIGKLFPSKTGNLTGCVRNWELGLNLPSPEQFSKICEEFNLPFESIKEAKREVIGKKQTNLTVMQNIGSDNISGEVDITAPATPEAKEWEGWGTALKPAQELWTLARKPLSEKTVAQNVLKWGTGGINIDECRVEANDQDKLEKNWDRIQSDKQGIASTGIKAIDLSDRKPTGRFPANIILDEAAGELLDEQSGESKSVSSKMKAGITEGIAAKDCSPNATQFESIRGHNDKGGASRFFYCAKASKSERNEGLEEFENQTTTDGRKKDIDNAFQRGKTERKNNHPTVKPIKLMEYLIKLITPTGGIVLDPYIGSGTTGVAAKKLGFNCIGIEREPEYVKIAEARINAVKDKLI